MGRAFSPLVLGMRFTWGVAPGWYGAGLWPLVLWPLVLMGSEEESGILGVQEADPLRG